MTLSKKIISHTFREVKYKEQIRFDDGFSETFLFLLIREFLRDESTPIQQSKSNPESIKLSVERNFHTDSDCPAIDVMYRQPLIV